MLILLVIIGHSNINLIVPHSTEVIYTFHMPLFFILSGFFLHKKEDTRLHVKKSFKSYILPYLYTCIVGVCLLCAKWLITGNVKYEGLLVDYSLRTVFVQVTQTTDIGPIWFLVALFWGQNLLIVLKSKLSDIELGISVVALAFVVLLVSEKIFVPFSLFQGVTALPFLYAGYLLKSHFEIIERTAKNKVCMVAIVVIWVLWSLLGNTIRISFVAFPHGCTSYVVSLLVPCILLYYSNHLDFGWLRCIGRHTLLILCVHTLVLQNGVLKIGHIQPTALYAFLEMMADVFITLLVSCMFIMIKKVLIHGNTSKGA